jgi:hypothetical protein
MLLDHGANRFHGLIVGNRLPALRLCKAALYFLHGFFGVFESITQDDAQHLLWRAPGLPGEFFESGELGFWQDNFGFQGNSPAAMRCAKFYSKDP